MEWADVRDNASAAPEFGASVEILTRGAMGFDIRGPSDKCA